VEEEETAGVVALFYQILSLVDLTETETVNELISDSVLEIGEGEVSQETVRDDLSVVRLLFPVYLGEGFMDHFFIIVLDSCKFSQLSPLIIVALFCVPSLAVQFEVAESAEYSHFFSYQIFHFDYATIPAPIFNFLSIPLFSNYLRSFGRLNEKRDCSSDIKYNNQT